MTSSTGCTPQSIPETNRIPHSWLFLAYTITISREFLTELAENHDVRDAVFRVDDADDLIGGLRREGLATAFNHTAVEIRSNVFFTR